jgi:hypothetical protein
MDRYDDLLNGLSPTITEAAVLVREVQVRVGVLPKRVAVRIYYDGKGQEPYRFELSATMSPDLARDCGDDAPCRAVSEADALRRAVRMLTQNYEAAIRQGRMPDDEWLIDSGRR